MEKLIKVINEKKGIVQITTLNERWYSKQMPDTKTGLPTFKYYPSVTWICGYYPKGIGFYKWLADKGWDEATAIKEAAGGKGSKVHTGCQLLDEGKEIKIDDKIVNPRTGQPEELTLEEWNCLVSYSDWHKEAKPVVLASEVTVFGENEAGTMDKILRLDKQIWIIDLKTSQHIWEEHNMQLSAYSHCDVPYKDYGVTDTEWKNRKLAILQLGYRLNKKSFKFTPIEDKYDLYRSVAYKTWLNENPDSKPKERDYPLTIKL
ncbi:MAG: hypothetical protein PHH73_00030 [Candidatus Rickettsiella isopodorum]|nr:hypothetical protein [Candidatus Rickettsiella isopodorum]